MVGAGGRSLGRRGLAGLAAGSVRSTTISGACSRRASSIAASELAGAGAGAATGAGAAVWASWIGCG